MARFINGGEAGQGKVPLIFALFLFDASAHAQNLPLPPNPNLPPFRWFASTDSQHQNEDYILLQPRETRRISLAAGTLERLWSTALFPDQIDLSLEAGPKRRQVLLSGGIAHRGLLAGKAFTFFPSLKSDPLGELEKSAVLVATNRASSPSKWYFQAAVRPKTAPRAQVKSSQLTRRQFRLHLAPGEEKKLESWSQAGEIDEFSVACVEKSTETFHNLRFKASFDGQRAVDASLLGLAGAIEGATTFRNAVANFEGSRLVLRWPMPFGSAEISLQNQGARAVDLDIALRERQTAAAPSPFRFCALEASALTQRGKPVKMLNLQGEGAFVGLALSIQTGEGSARRTFAFLEGNERITSDGRVFEGTGTEDFFSSAWYFPDAPFARPFEGLTRKTNSPPAVSAYRWMIADAIPFQKSLLFHFEHGNGNNAPDFRWKWTAMWYQKPPLSLPATNAEAAPREISSPAPVAPQERWKIALAVGAGVFLGAFSAWWKRRR